MFVGRVSSPIPPTDRRIEEVVLDEETPSVNTDDCVSLKEDDVKDACKSHVKENGDEVEEIGIVFHDGASTRSTPSATLSPVPRYAKLTFR